MRTLVVPGAWLAALGTCLAMASASAADTQRGSTLYRTHCASCHGSDGRPVLAGAPDFTRPTALLKPDLVLAAGIRSGKGAMPGFAALLRDPEVLDIVAHLRTLR